jgi:iron complex transport system permease protein
VRITGMVIASVSTAVAVSFFGIIAFVGLVVPHIVRAVIGSDERFLIPGSALFGGLFLLVADTAARTIISPVVLPVGILTSFIGAPLFLFLLVSRKRRSQW